MESGDDTKSKIPKMSILQDDLEQYSAMDLDPLEGLHRPSPGSPLAIGEQLSDTENEGPGEKRGCEEELNHAMCVNKLREAKEILDENPNALTARIDSKGKTALHLAAQYGYITMVEELLRLLPPEFLEMVDSEGFTPLGLACSYNGNTHIAKCLVDKNSGILAISSMRDDLPVTVAFANNFQEMGRYLYSVTPFECLTGRSGSKLLCHCLQAQCFDIALNLLQRHEELLFVPSDRDDKEFVPMLLIATLNTVILSPSELIFWKRWIYNYINKPSTTAINHVSLDIQQEDRSRGDPATFTEPGQGLLQRLITSTGNFVGVKKIQELKLLHAQVDALLLLVCKNIRNDPIKDIDGIHAALRLAAKEGNVDFVLQVSKEIPEIFLRQLMFACFSGALHYRQARVFNLIHGFRFKHGLVTSRLECDRSTLMHSAATRAPDHILNRIYTPTLQMQRELQWFKEVESLMPPSIRGFRNKNGLKAKELFRESHGELLKEGEKWIKDTASSCSVVSTLIVTIMFAAAFTIPGGNDQNLGYPLFIKQPFFKVFVFSTIISFLSSSTSVLMFLAILISQYLEEKFLKSLPTKLILGLSFLFISIVSMITSFLSTTYLMFNHTNYSWGLLPIMILASVPIFLFVLSQFPLLLHTYVSTYGNLFDRNVKPWP